MAILEYELRYFLINGTFIENPLPDEEQPPIGIGPEREKKLQILLILNMICTLSTVLTVVSRYRLTLSWKIEKKLVLPSDTLFTTREYQNLLFEIFLMSLAPIAGC
jgi:hypothetical protein